MQAVIIKQQSKFKCYNLGKNVQDYLQCVSVWMLFFVFPSPFLLRRLLTRESKNTSTRSGLKLVGASAISQTLSLAVSTTFNLLLDLYMQRMQVKDDGHAWLNANWSSNYPPLCPTSAWKSYTLCPKHQSFVLCPWRDQDNIVPATLWNWVLHCYIPCCNTYPLCK